MLVYADENNLEQLMQQDFCMVDFYSETCGPCRMLAGILAKLESELPFVSFIKVNTTQYPNYAAKYEIRAVPTLFFVKNGAIAERHVGTLNAEQLKEKIGTYLYT
ncbi:MAG: thioredoxin family protein [Lachnospiraceae bacterium]|nr:thioredoxin family protein [Lachnospiraceae bacterium]